MKFKLVETILTEGKNIDRTWEQYKDKMFLRHYNKTPESAIKALDGNQKALDAIYDNLKDVWLHSILAMDPTYDGGTTTTGDFGIWLTNLWVNGKLSSIDNDKVSTLLDEFIKKKPNLEKKDINQYKSVEDLQSALENTSLPRKQERKNSKGVKQVFQGKDWDIFIPETYEASCALGAGSGWCTADTRTRGYYDEYLQRGGDYYIIINKHNPKDKYQFHWESRQFFASGTCPQYNTPNKERQINEDEFLSKNKEVGKFFIKLGYWKDWSKETYYWDGRNRIPKSVVSVIIEDGVAQIGYQAFDNCTSLKEITIPNSVTIIKGSAFYNCKSLKEIIIPEGVRRIYSNAFAHCISLEKIVIGNDVTYIGEDAFRHCDSLTHIEIPDGVTKIDNGAFSFCKTLPQIIIPNSVEEIGYDVFTGCNSITKIVLPGEFSTTNLSELGIDTNQTEVIFR